MNLFKFSQKLNESNPSTLIYPTPLGKVYFNLIVNGNEIFKIKPSVSGYFDKSIINRWNLKECDVEFLFTPFNPKIPPSMKVESCCAAIWRIRNKSQNLKTIFKTHLEKEATSRFETYPDSGEGFTSQTFVNEKLILSIGTEDEDYLSQRASVQKWIPNRFHNVLDPSMVDCVSYGLQISLPPLDKEEFLQIQFIVACALKKYPESSTWFAVDQDSDYILDSINVT